MISIFECKKCNETKNINHSEGNEVFTYCPKCLDKMIISEEKYTHKLMPMVIYNCGGFYCNS